MPDTASRLDVGLRPPYKLLQPQQPRRERHVVLQILLRIHRIRLLIGAVLLHVQADRRAAGAGPREAHHDARAVVERDENALVPTHAAVEVGVGEVVGDEDGTAGNGRADKGGFVRRDEILHVRRHFVRAGRVAAFVVVAGEEGATVGFPKVHLDALDAGCGACLLADCGDDVHPGGDGPEAVLLAHVVASRAEGFLAADVHVVGVEEAAEELPAGGHFVALETFLLGDQVDGAAGGHAACQAGDALFFEVGDMVGVVRDDGETVAGRDECACTVDHVSVAVTVAGGAEVDAVLVHGVDERFGVDEVGVGMVTAEVGFRYAVLRAAFDAELVLEDVDAVGARNTAESVEEDLEVGVLAQEGFDEGKVEDFFEVVDVILGRVDDLDVDGTNLLLADLGKIHVGQIGHDLVGLKGFGCVVDFVGDALRCRGTVGEIVLDAKVFGWACSTL